MLRIMTLLCFVALLSGCTEEGSNLAASPGAPAKPVTAQTIADTYRELTMRSDGYEIASAGLAVLCAPGTSVSELCKLLGAHAQHYNAFYMNDLAYQALQKQTSYPVGSIIVKEKVHQDAKEIPEGPEPGRFTDRPKTISGIGGMIKRAPGYDPKHGDWEYFYRDQNNKLESGIISSCVNCHRLAAKTDYVYGRWAKN